MKTWKTNLEETKQRYINWWNHNVFSRQNL